MLRRLVRSVAPASWVCVTLLSACAARPAPRTTPEGSGVVEIPPPPPEQPPTDRSLVLAGEPVERSTDTAGVSREPCSSANHLKSLVSDTSLFIEFRNESPGPVSIEWIDFHGRRVHYADLGVGERYRQQTYVTHPWIALDADGGCRGVFLPRSAGVHAVVVGAR